MQREIETPDETQQRHKLCSVIAEGNHEKTIRSAVGLEHYGWNDRRAIFGAVCQTGDDQLLLGR